MKKAGRPKFEVTLAMRNNVELLAGCGLEQSKIAIVIGCSESTLKRAFVQELQNGGAKLEALVCKTILVNLQKGGSVGQRAAEFLAHTRLGWSRYAPPPATPKELEAGKKEKLNQAAQTGHEHTSWGDVLH